MGAREQAANLMNLRSKEIMQGENFPDAILFVDDHVQCYHGKKKLGQTCSSSKNRGSVDGATYELLIKLGCDFIAYHKNPKPVQSEVFLKEETLIILTART